MKSSLIETILDMCDMRGSSRVVGGGERLGGLFVCLMEGKLVEAMEEINQKHSLMVI